MGDKWSNIKYFAPAKNCGSHSSRINNDKVYVAIRFTESKKNSTLLNIYFGSHIAKLLNFNPDDYVDTLYLVEDPYILKICKSSPNEKAQNNNRLIVANLSKSVRYVSTLRHINLKETDTKPIDYDITTDCSCIINLKDFKV